MRKSLLLILFALMQLGIYAIDNKALQPADDNKYPIAIPDGSIFHIDDSLLQITCPSACIKPTSRPATKGVFSHSQRIHFTPNNSNCPYYLIIAENSLYNSLSNEIRTYAEDAHAIFGYGVYVETIQNPTPEDVKSLIVNYSNNLRGTLFIGDIGESMYEVPNDYDTCGYRNWPCDLYYMDLDGVWTDSDSNGIYDGHTGYVAPEIFLGRLSTYGLSSYGTEEVLIRRQLQKSHNYWWKTSYHAQQTTLNYIDKDWEKYHFKAETIKTVFPTLWITDIRHDSISNFFSVSDYLNRINSTTYGFTQLASHSDPVKHYFINGNIYDNIHNYEIKNINSNNYAYNLFCCSACNWLGANTNGYIGGAYLFNNGKTMTVIGSTKTGGMYTVGSFYPALITKNIGEAYLQWWNSYGVNHLNDDIYWIYGMTILGDPIIDFRYNVSDLCVNNLSLTSFPSNNTSNLIIYKAGNKITVSGNFVIPQGVHVIFDAPQVIFDSTFTCPLGASFETRSEGCEL